MKIDTKCCICGRLDERWRELNLEMVRSKLVQANSARAMMDKVLKLDLKKQLMVVLLMWLWWDERNKRREEGRRRTAVEVAYVTAALTDRFQKQAGNVLLSENRQVQKWTKPPPGVFKINADGAFDSKSSHGGWGFIIRDDQGSMVKASAANKKHLLDPLHAELLACLAGVRMAALMGLSQVILETDAALVNSALEGDEYRLSAWGGIITEIRLLLMTEFNSFSICKCPRMCNSVVDALAAYGSRVLSGD